LSTVPVKRFSGILFTTDGKGWILKARLAVGFAAFAIALAADAEASQCGSALLLEVDPPAVLDGVEPLAFSMARFWEAGLGGSNGSDAGCLSGCTLLSGPDCASGTECIALTGVNWLNASCSVAGRLPSRTIFMLEQETADSGGRWAAINLDRNENDANTDLDSKAASICASCTSVLSPYLGGDGRPAVSSSSSVGGTLVVDLVWAPPHAGAQALSNGPNLVTGYGIYYRSDNGTPPPATGDPSGWVRVADSESDGAMNDGYSVDTNASLELTIDNLQENVSFAIGLNFDGTGNPVVDGNTIVSAFLSDSVGASDRAHRLRWTKPPHLGEPNSK